MNLIAFFEKIIDFPVKGNVVDVIFLDFEVFNMMPHWRLLFKMAKMETSGRIKRWVRNWLNMRLQ